ncbi:DNA methyltransferase [Novosphingobium aquae]|uniref:Methyltransferase n=1 Tax=Novosphingobium aquae TaxID=3133435 RepID=A0ABU8SB52_9SPHN
MAKDICKTTKLKKLLQETSAQRRSSNQAAKDVEAARHMPGRNDLQPRLQTLSSPIDALTVSANRTRETTPQLLESLIRSIKKFGMITPILIDQDNVIVAGHAIWEAARKLGLEEIECRVIDHLDPIEREALALALNRIGEIGKFDLVKLRERIITIESHGIELISTGFTLPEIDQIKFVPLVEGAGEESEAEIEAETRTSRLGDMFRLGRNRLQCGDALDERSYRRVLGGSLAHAIFSDPPYNCKIEGFVGGLGKHKHEDFIKFAGKESAEEFAMFLATYLQLCRTFSSPGAVVFACMDWRQIELLLTAGSEAGLHRINMAVWNKGSGGMGGLYRSAHELITVFCNGKTPITNNVELGVHGRDRTNVWTYAGANRRGSSASLALADHPTPKPVELVVDALLDVTRPGDSVLDPFMGSGTTIIACEQCDRVGYGIELDPKYVDRAINRWEALTGENAVHIDSGLTFAELLEQRAEHQVEIGDV